ncbi:MAG: ATP-binding protein, partial [Chthoniobacterales bacterium]
KPEPVVMAPVDLPGLVREAIQSLGPQAEHAGVKICEEIDPAWGDHPVSGDRERLRQVLCNLLLNAIQSMPEGGMGLGLAVSKEIIQSHGGQISATNLAGGGSDVRIEWAQN